MVKNRHISLPKCTGKFWEKLSTDKASQGDFHELPIPDAVACLPPHFSVKSSDYRLVFTTLTRRFENFISARQYGTFSQTASEKLGTMCLQEEGYYYSLYYPLYPAHTLVMGHQAPAQDIRDREHAPLEEDAAQRVMTELADNQAGTDLSTPPTQPHPETPEIAAVITVVPIHSSLRYTHKGWLASDGLPDGATASARQFSFSRE
ncbi:hypothetical protein EAY64_05335 [Aquitalea palustris]|uniref:Uncharacterized protein n=1 Tax=Aquitalea palustris TaxID=2480983 RepID=A0A454JL47_9NEIS|nr:hypothetical protein [Aquitalea palustris]RMD00147.1 hypothetical protein EAY64_05335 [Aquitalea palustris]